MQLEKLSLFFARAVYEPPKREACIGEMLKLSENWEDEECFSNLPFFTAKMFEIIRLEESKFAGGDEDSASLKLAEEILKRCTIRPGPDDKNHICVSWAKVTKFTLSRITKEPDADLKRAAELLNNITSWEDCLPGFDGSVS